MGERGMRPGLLWFVDDPGRFVLPAIHTVEIIEVPIECTCTPFYSFL
jgi:hypothetical protein